jgi:hypothetical protein
MPVKNILLEICLCDVTYREGRDTEQCHRMAQVGKGSKIGQKVAGIFEWPLIQFSQHPPRFFCAMTRKLMAAVVN